MVDELVEAVERARDAVIEAVAHLRPDQATFKASADEWSITENVEHLYLAELSGLAKIWSAALDVRSGAVWTGDGPGSVDPVPPCKRG